MKLRLFFAVMVIGLSFYSGLALVGALTVGDDVKKSLFSNLEVLQVLPTTINNVKIPKLTNPEWLQIQLDENSIITYDVTTRGNISTSLAGFKSLANQTLNDSRGWSRLGIKFQEVTTGGNFTLVLSEASYVPSFNISVCSRDWSCQIGRYVIINQDRWLGASDAWNSAKGSLRDYQHMVINHETGHWLGHGHDNSGCSVSTQLAPVMQQQSMYLLGCKFNPWPLSGELWSSRV